MTNKNKIFNTPFEMLLHILILLDSVDYGFTIERITDYDFIAVYAQYFGFNFESLNGDNEFAFSEFPVKRNLVKKAIKILVLDGLVIASDSEEGIIYSLSDSGLTMSRRFRSDYAILYRKAIFKINRRYRNKSEVELADIINKRSMKASGR